MDLSHLPPRPYVWQCIARFRLDGGQESDNNQLTLQLPPWEIPAELVEGRSIAGTLDEGPEGATFKFEIKYAKDAPYGTFTSLFATGDLPTIPISGGTTADVGGTDGTLTTLRLEGGWWLRLDITQIGSDATGPGVDFVAEVFAKVFVEG